MLMSSRQVQRVPRQIQSRGAKAPLQELWQRFLRVRYFLLLRSVVTRDLIRLFQKMHEQKARHP